jgi:hypothetical protein
MTCSRFGNSALWALIQAMVHGDPRGQFLRPQPAMAAPMPARAAHMGTRTEAAVALPRASARSPHTPALRRAAAISAIGAQHGA